MGRSLIILRPCREGDGAPDTPPPPFTAFACHVFTISPAISLVGQPANLKIHLAKS